VATQYEIETYEGRIISDKKSEGFGYCGSGSLEMHIKQMNDPTFWVQSCLKSFHNAYLESEREKQFNLELLDELRFIRDRTKVLDHLNKAAKFIDNEIRLLNNKLGAK